MASSINSTSAGNGGLISTGDDSGILNIQTNETTAITVDASQNTTFAGKVTSVGALTLASNGTTTAVTIDTSQNVGIGTTTPVGKLSVYGTGALATFQNATTGAAGSDGSYIALGGSDLQISNRESANMIFYTVDTERMRIDSSGGLILAGSTAQKATGTTWSNPSDQRLKDNIRDYVKGTTELMQVRVREWEYNGKGGTIEGTKGLGVVADEVMVVLPDTVENYEAKLNSDDEETTEIKKFDATEITWLLVKTVQELKAIVDTQAETINALTARIVALEGQ